MPYPTVIHDFRSDLEEPADQPFDTAPQWPHYNGTSNRRQLVVSQRSFNTKNISIVAIFITRSDPANALCPTIDPGSLFLHEDGGATDFLPLYVEIENAMFSNAMCQLWSAHKATRLGLLAEIVPVLEKIGTYIPNHLVVTDC